MPNKRFLGLGFTFAATDKGLEKKLKGVNSQLSLIRQNIKDINKDSKKMTGRLKNAFSPFSKGRKTTGVRGRPSIEPRMSRASKRTAAVMPSNEYDYSEDKDFKKEEKKFKKVNLAGVFTEMAGAKEIFGDISKLFKDKKSLEMFHKQASEMKFFMDDAGKLAQRSSDDFMHLVEKMSEISKEADTMGVKWAKMKPAFTGMKEYFGDIFKSSKHFLDTIGLDLGGMIPKEFKALFGVFKSVLSGPMKLLGKAGASLFGKRKDKKEKIYQTDLNKIHDALETSKSHSKKTADQTKELFGISDQLSPWKSKNKSIAKILLDLFDVEKEKGKGEKGKGILGTLMEKVMSVFTGIIPALMGLVPVITSALATFMSAAAPAFAVAAAGAIGYAIGTILDKGMDKIFDKFGVKGGLGGAVFQGAEGVGDFLNKKLGTHFETTAAMTKAAEEKAKANYLKSPAHQQAIAATVPLEAQKKAQELRDATSANQDQANISRDMLDEQKAHTQAINKLADTMTSKPATAPQVNVNMNMDAKKMGIQLRAREISEAASTGSGG